MSDPEVEAWARAAAKTSPSDALRAAREALAPIRDLHKPETTPWPYFVTSDSPTNITGCDHCNVTWPCDTARLIYTTEELA